MKRFIELLDTNSIKINYDRFSIEITPEKMLKTTVKAKTTEKSQTVTTDILHDSCLQAVKCFKNATYGIEAILGDPIYTPSGKLHAKECCCTQFNSLNKNKTSYGSYTTFLAFCDDTLEVTRVNQNKYSFKITLDVVNHHKENVRFTVEFKPNNSYELQDSCNAGLIHIEFEAVDVEHLNNICGKMQIEIKSNSNKNANTIVLYGCEYDEFGEYIKRGKKITRTIVQDCIENAIYWNSRMLVDLI